MSPRLLIIPLLLIPIAACSDSNGTDADSASQDSPVSTTAPTTDAPTTTAAASAWSRDTLVAMEPCLSVLRLLDLGDVDDATVEQAYQDCDPASDQVSVDADLAGGVEASTVYAAMAEMMVMLSFYRLSPDDGAEVKRTVSAFLDLWEQSAP